MIRTRLPKARTQTAALAGALLLLSQGAAAQDIRTSLFGSVDSLLVACREARADLLAPKAFGEGTRYYRRAEEGLERGRNLESIRKDLNDAQARFDRALESTRLAVVTFAAALAARDNAVQVGAPEHSARTWTNAERKFSEAAMKLEDGDVNEARRKSAEAEGMFRQAELEAIKTNYLQDAWALLAEAEDRDVYKRAPVTFDRARNLAGQAEGLLNESRYDADEPRSLAQEARYEAGHALYLSAQIEDVEEERITLESLLLSLEQPLARIAGAMDIVASFDAGPGETTRAMLDRVAAYQDSIESLLGAVEGRDHQIAGLGARIAELEGELGGVQRERSDLAERIAAQAQWTAKFSRIEGMFARTEARVLREGSDVIIRLTGLVFAVGSSYIEPDHYGLLTNVERAIAEFPGARLTIEGHTDAFGSDASNLQLSQERAEAVREYLLANTRLDPSKIDAIGYGEARPVASNETPESRARNRRIEVVIHPPTAAGN